MSLNTDLNIFLALLEDRPEAAKNILGSLPHRVSSTELTKIQGRIEQARENIKCQAVKGALRLAFNDILKINAKEFVHSSTSEMDSAGLTPEDVFLQGVEAVEGILTKLIETCEDTEKKLGPPVEVLP
jgi:hypothetical protein